MAQELRIHRDTPQQNRAPQTRSSQAQRAWPMPMLSPFEEIDRLFDELLPMVRLGRSPVLRELMTPPARVPSIDLLERDDDIVLRAEVPGFSKEDLEISMDDSSVTIRGTTAHDEQDAEGGYYRRECVHGEFMRTIPLPAQVATEKVTASLKNGVLELVMPRLEATRRRKIKIS